MATCKQCKSEIQSPLWKLSAVDFLQTEYSPRTSRFEKLRIDAGVFCSPGCMTEYLEGAQNPRRPEYEGASEDYPAIGGATLQMLDSEESANSHGREPRALWDGQLSDYRQGIVDVRGNNVPFIIGCRHDGQWIAEIQLRDEATATGRADTEQKALANALSVITGEQINPETVEEKTG